MNATEMGRRSDSLYYDNVSRRELCDRIAHLESDLDAAKNDLSIFSGELVKSKAENAKLRDTLESCAILLTDKDFFHWPELMEETLKCMSELGIEVW